MIEELEEASCWKGLSLAPDTILPSLLPVFNAVLATLLLYPLFPANPAGFHLLQRNLGVLTKFLT